MASSTTDLAPTTLAAKTRIVGRPWLLLGAAIVVGALFAFPALYLIWRSLTVGAEPGQLVFGERVLAPLGRTIQLGVLVTATATVVGTALAWLTTRTDLPWSRTWRLLLPLPLVFPTFVGAAAMIRTVNPGGLVNDVVTGIGIESTPELRGLGGAWLVLTLFTFPYVYLPAAAAFRRLSGSIEDSARVLGDGPWLIFWRVCLPQAGPAIGAGALLVFLYTVSDFGAVVLLRYDTLTRAIHTNYLANPPVALALSLMLLALAAVLATGERWMSSRRQIRPPARSGRPVVYALGRWRPVALAGVALWLAVALGGPLITLVDWSLRGLLRTGGRGLTIDEAEIVAATWGSLQVGLASAVVAVMAVLPVAYLVARYRSGIGGLTATVVISSFALPGLLVALSIHFWLGQAAWADRLLGNTMTLLVLAYVIRFGSLAMGVTLVAVRSIPAQLADAAATLGAGWWRRLATIDLPLMAPGLGAAAGLVLLSVLKELPISLLVSPVGYSNLATRIYQSFVDAFVSETGILALVLVALSFVLSWFLVIRRADHL